jgi:hypothetical protein
LALIPLDCIGHALTIDGDTIVSGNFRPRVDFLHTRIYILSVAGT